MKPQPKTKPKGMRIWYQSFTDPQETHRYHHRLHDYLQAAASRGTHIDVIGMSPPSRRHRTTELRCALDVVKNAIHAEREGYDAFILGHFQDSGLWEARSAAAIPVIGLGEAAMLHACTLGRKSALVTIHPIHIPYHEEQVLRYGLQQRIVHVSAVESNASDYVTAFDDTRVAKKIAAKYAKEVAALVGRQIEVVIPAGGLPSLLFGSELRMMAGDAVVMDSLSVSVAAAETAVRLARFNGLGTSRALTFRLPWKEAYEALGMPLPKKKAKARR